MAGDIIDFPGGPDAEVEGATDQHTRTLNRPTTSDPTGKLDIFDRSAVPSITDGADKIYEYVESKAQEIGEHVKRNRGLPPGASPENMLSVSEKAVCILGRAVGVVWSEIEDRIYALRAENDQPPPTRNLYELSTKLLKSHGKIIGAIQADMLTAVEAFSPLVGGQQRFLWRARLVEFYRRRIMEIEADPKTERDDKDFQIRMLDQAQRPHLKWFDDLGHSSDIAKFLRSPDDVLREQNQTQAEADLKALRDSGEISETEYIDQLRTLRHGSE